MAGNIRLTLNYKVTKNGEDFNGGSNYWAGLDDTSFAALLALAGEFEGNVKKQADKGGPLSVELTATIDGAPVPSTFTPTVSYSGLTLHGLNKVEKDSLKLGERLAKMGEDHADKKEGKPKP